MAESTSFMYDDSKTKGLSAHGFAHDARQHDFGSLWNKQYVHMSLVFMAIFVVAELILIGTTADEASITSQLVQWQWMLIFLLFFGGTSSYARTAVDFYSGGSIMGKDEGEKPRTAFAFLTLSAFISWVFAKSVANASSLGAQFGWVGGIAYACYYTSFLSAGLTIAALRRQGFESLPGSIHAKYGKLATFSFLLAIAYRLYNEIWSNTVVVAGFYGAEHSAAWWWAAVVGALIPVSYGVMGGLRMSIYSDLSQALMAVVLLLIVIGTIFSKPASDGLLRYNPNPANSFWSLAGGFDLAIVGLLQGLFSYPFFDPVLTDRAFLSSVRVMVPSFICAGTLGAAFIFLFSFLGIYGAKVGVGGLPQDVARSLGPAAYSLVSLIMITSSLSTLDSAFASTSKALGLEALSLIRTGSPKSPTDATTMDMVFGRIAMCVMLIVGTLPLIGNVVVLNATTAAGTVVIGLGPPVIGGIFVGPGARFLSHTRLPAAFHMSFWSGVGWGAALQSPIPKTVMTVGNGSYAQLLGFNLYGLLTCIGMYLLGLALHKYVLPVIPTAGSVGEESSAADSDRVLEKSGDGLDLKQEKEKEVLAMEHI